MNKFYIQRILTLSLYGYGNLYSPGPGPKNLCKALRAKITYSRCQPRVSVSCCLVCLQKSLTYTQFSRFSSNPGLWRRSFSQP